MIVRLCLIGVVIAAVSGFRPASAQVTSPRALAPGVEVEMKQPGGAGPARIDDTAVRYYARIGDVERMEAEISRLRALDPTWQPPKDLFSPAVAGYDETPLWRMLSDGRIAEARASIAEQRRKDAAWRPSEKLLAELDLAEAAAGALAASEGRRWKDVVDLVAAEPRLLVCERLDMMWRAAEAFGELKRTEEAIGLYRDVVSKCPSAADRRDTLYKASRYLPPERIDELANLARSTLPGGENPDLIAQAVDEMRMGRVIDAIGRRGATIADDELARAAAAVSARRNADGALALGWFFQSRKRFEDARSWFSQANDWEPSDRAAEGLIFAYLGLKKPEEAKAAAQPWQGKSRRVAAALGAARTPEPAKAVPVAKSPASANNELALVVARGDWGQCLTVIQRLTASQAMTADLAQQRGWCLLELDRPAEAERAFSQAKSLAAKATAAERKRLTEIADYGTALARARQNDTGGVQRQLNGTDMSDERRAEIRASLLASQAQTAFDEKRYLDALRLLDARKAVAAEERGLTLLRGWSLFKSGRQREAIALFQALDRRLSTAESREALSLATQATN